MKLPLACVRWSRGEGQGQDGAAGQDGQFSPLSSPVHTISYICSHTPAPSYHALSRGYRSEMR